MKLTSGAEIQYALGLTVGSYRGTREIGHSGSTAGYSTYLARYPEKDNLSIAVMCNAAGAPATTYAHGIVDALYPDLPRAASPDTTALGAADVSALAGIYRDTRTNTSLVLQAAGDGLRRQGGGAVRAVRDGSFLVGPARMRAVRGGGRITALRQATSDGDSLEFVRVSDARWTATAADLATVAGKYRNDEIGVTFDVRAVAAPATATITISPRAGVADTATSLYREKNRDAFSSGGDAVWFERDAKGRVTAMHFGSSRVWDFVSVRVP
jgi:hypothetical protein